MADSFSTLNLKAFIQGYYIGGGLMTAVLFNQGVNSCSVNADTVEVELRDTITYSVVASDRVLLQTDGTAQCRFANTNGTYYLVIRHRSGLQTWSASPVTINGSVTATYDFTTAVSQSYGNNMALVEPGVYAIYSGDLNQDENIDLLDAGILEFGINGFIYGYETADINGDGNVDLLDNPILENNISSFIYAMHP